MNRLHKLVAASLGSYYQSRLRKDQVKEPRQLKEIQFRKLKAILKHACEYVPYYHRSFSAAKIRPDDIKNFEDMQKIPVVSKQDVQKNLPVMVARGVETSRLYFGSTSGSTGIPLKVLHDYSFTRSSYHHSANSYILTECGVKPTDNYVTVWGRDSPSIQWGKRYTRLWGHVSETTVPLSHPAKLVNALRLVKPDVLSSFPSVLSTLADYDTSGICPRIVITQGESVTQHCRDLVKEVFGLELFETYGSVEFGNLAFECDNHRGLHMITNRALIEFIDETGEYVAPEEQGEIIVTGFLNFVMPLIRYRIGDSGIQSDEKCSCGRSWPLIESIEGRLDDFLVLPSGRKISWLHIIRGIYDVFFRRNVLGISQFQVIQERKNRVILSIVKGREFKPERLGQIQSSLKAEFDRLGEHLEIVTQIVDDIPMERTGKRRTVISKVHQ